MWPYQNIALVPAVFDKLTVWQEALEQRWDRPVTKSEVVDWLIDNAGVPIESVDAS